MCRSSPQELKIEIKNKTEKYLKIEEEKIEEIFFAGQPLKDDVGKCVEAALKN